jgi:hypothetical protein
MRKVLYSPPSFCQCLKMWSSTVRAASSSELTRFDRLYLADKADNPCPEGRRHIEPVTCSSGRAC